MRVLKVAFAVAAACAVAVCGDAGTGPARPAQIAVAGGDGQSGSAGAALTDSLAVRVADAGGKPVAGAAVAWSVTAGAGTVTPASSTTSASGIARARWTLGTVPGVNTVTAAVAGLAPVTFTATVGPAPAARVTVAGGDLQTQPAGSPLHDSLLARVTDQYDNPVPGATVSWAVTTGGGSVSPAASATGSDGVARASWTLGPAAGAHTATAAVTGATPATFRASAVAGPAARIAIASGNAQAGLAATPLRDSLVVRVTDAYDNAVAGATVTWSVTTGGGSISPSSGTTGSDGRTWTRWTLGPGLGANSVKAGLASPEVSASFSATALRPLDYCLEQDPTDNGGCNLTEGFRASWRPSVSGSRVVWEALQPDGHSGVEMYDVATGEYTLITPPGWSHANPVIDGDIVAYTRAAGGGFQLYYYDLTTRLERFVATIGGGFNRIALSGQRIAWSMQRDDGLDFDVYVYDIATRAMTRLTRYAADQAWADIRGDVVAWADYRRGRSYGDLYMYDLSTGAETRLTQDTTLLKPPAVMAERIVWGDRRQGGSPYAYELSGTPHERRIYASGMSTDPSAFGHFAAWSTSGACPTCGEIVLYDFSTDTEHRLPGPPALRIMTALSAEYLVWHEERDGRADVYIARISRLTARP